MMEWGQEAIFKLQEWTQKGHSSGSPPHKQKRKGIGPSTDDKENEDPNIRGQATWLTEALGVALSSFGSRVQSELENTNKKVDIVEKEVVKANSRVDVIETEILKKTANDVSRDEEFIA